MLFYPVTDANFDYTSYREFANGPWLTKPAMEWFWKAARCGCAEEGNGLAFSGIDR